MAILNRVRVEWAGGITGPGLSTFYVQGTLSDVSGITDFFDDIKALFPSDLDWTIPGTGDQIDSANGELAGSWSASGGGAVAATGSGAYAAPAGALVTWRTSSIIGGRRLQGRTFLVPLVVSAYESNGTLSTTTQGTLTTAATTMLAAVSDLTIWHRPDENGNGGGLGLVTQSLVKDRVVTLRSRRD